MRYAHLAALMLCTLFAACGADEPDDVLGVERQAATASSGPSGAACRQDLATSRWVACAEDGTLRYAADKATGATLLDYSRVGYHGGDDLVPTFPLRQHVAPSGKDDTAQLQAAINAVSALAPNAQGIRGRVKLAPGLFHIDRPLIIAKSGVSVEGTASVGKNATTLQVVGNATSAFYVRGANTTKVTTKVLPIAQLPVPAGADRLTLASVQGLTVGDLVRLTSTRSEAWIRKKWGGTYPPKRDGKEQAAWGTHMTLMVPRTVVAIAGNVVTLDAPVPDTLPGGADAQKEGAYLQKLDTSGYIREFGFAHLRLAGRFVDGEITDPKLLIGFVIANAEDGWIDDVEATDFGSGTVHLDSWTRRITVQDVRTIRTKPQPGSAKPSDISLQGQLHLIQGCASHGDKTFYVAPQKIDAAGPNVVQNYRAAGTGTFEPHQRWSTGVLYDNVYAPDAGIALINRGTFGSGHGWAMGFGAVYNSLAGTGNKQKAGMNSLPGLTIDQPPGAANWGIGLVGPNHSAKQADLHYDSAGKPVAPATLWGHQLWVRRGSVALSQVMGPWYVQEAARGLCLSVDVARAGSFLVLRDCGPKKQLAVWDITSRGNLRLGGTSLCVDAGSDRRNTPAKLAACEDDDEQRWMVGARSAQPTSIRLKKAGGGTDACLLVDNAAATVGPCAPGAAPWRLNLTHLAR